MSKIQWKDFFRQFQESELRELKADEDLLMLGKIPWSFNEKSFSKDGLILAMQFCPEEFTVILQAYEKCDTLRVTAWRNRPLDVSDPHFMEGAGISPRSEQILEMYLRPVGPSSPEADEQQEIRNEVYQWTAPSPDELRLIKYLVNSVLEMAGEPFLNPPDFDSLISYSEVQDKFSFQIQEWEKRLLERKKPLLASWDQFKETTKKTKTILPV